MMFIKILNIPKLNATINPDLCVSLSESPQLCSQIFQREIQFPLESCLKKILKVIFDQFRFGTSKILRGLPRNLTSIRKNFNCQEFNTNLIPFKSNSPCQYRLLNKTIVPPYAIVKLMYSNIQYDKYLVKILINYSRKSFSNVQISSHIWGSDIISLFLISPLTSKIRYCKQGNFWTR